MVDTATARQNIIEQLVDGAPNTITPSKTRQLIIDMFDALIEEGQPFSITDGDRAPTVNDDGANSSGTGVFKAGSKWFDQTANETYICLKNDTGNALWVKTSLTLDELGNAAILNAGTAPNNLVQLDGTGKLPALDGSQLLNLPAPSVGDGTITTVKLANSAVTEAKLADDAVTTDKILNDAVTADKIVDKTIAPGKLAENILADGTDLNTVIDSGSYRLVGNHINWPDQGANHGQMIVSKNSDSIFQMISYYHNNKVYVRSGYGIDYNTTFLPWRELGGFDEDQLCTAWVNFNGVGTVSIRDSFNVSSITRNGTGDYTINFASPLANVNYAVSGTAENYTITVPATGMSVNSVRVYCVRPGVATYDEDHISVTIFGGA